MGGIVPLERGAGVVSAHFLDLGEDVGHVGAVGPFGGFGVVEVDFFEVAEVGVCPCGVRHAHFLAWD